jgi:hypothetical protein
MSSTAPSDLPNLQALAELLEKQCFPLHQPGDYAEEVENGIVRICRKDGTLVAFMTSEDYNDLKEYGETMAFGDFGKSEVTVKKAELLERMKTNLLKHRAMFLEAQEGYRDAVIKELDAMLKEARDGKAIRRLVELEEPHDHSDEYETNIAMLEWSVSDTLSISQQQFKNFVLDKWGWSEQFITSNATYKKK